MSLVEHLDELRARLVVCTKSAKRKDPEKNEKPTEKTNHIK